MLTDIEAGIAQGIICWKLDRLARNPKDAGQLLWMLNQGIIQSIKTLRAEYTPESSRLISYVEFGMSDQEIQTLKHRVISSMMTKRNQGWFPHRAPIGYLNDRTLGKGKGRITPDPERFEIIKSCWKRLLVTKCSIQDLYDYATYEQMLRRRKDGWKFTRSAFYNLFNNPFYYGMFIGKGILYQGSHIPMISKAEFDLAQLLIHRADNPRPSKHTHRYSGLIRCARCGHYMTGDVKKKVQKNGRVHCHTYYRCCGKIRKECDQTDIREDRLEAQIKAAIAAIEIPENLHRLLLSVMKQKQQENSQSIQNRVATLQRNLSICENKFRRLIDMRLSGEIDEIAFKEYSNQLRRKRWSSGR